MPAPPFGEQCKGLAGIDAAVIKRAAGDRACRDARNRARSRRLISSIEARPPEAMTGIGIDFGKRQSRFDIEALQHAVAVDVGDR